jgi:hypothetical protein
LISRSIANLRIQWGYRVAIGDAHATNLNIFQGLQSVGVLRISATGDDVVSCLVVALREFESDAAIDTRDHDCGHGVISPAA